MGKSYGFCEGAKLACFTWHGAVLETSGEEGVRGIYVYIGLGLCVDVCVGERCDRFVIVYIDHDSLKPYPTPQLTHPKPTPTGICLRRDAHGRVRQHPHPARGPAGRGVGAGGTGAAVRVYVSI